MDSPPNSRSPFHNDDVLPALRIGARARQDLGFDDAMAIIGGLCRTPFGRDALADDVFPEQHAELRLRLRAAMEAKAAVQRLVAPDFAGLREVRHILEASGKGIVLAATDIIDVARTIDAIGRLKDVMEAQDDDAPELVRLAEFLADERRFSRRVLRSFDDVPSLVDDASPELSVRRQRVRVLRQEAQERLVELVRDYDDLGVLRDRNFTIRNDRYVLPVKSEYQGKVDGIVHDASQTHQTVFIEPRALLQLGNRIKIARAEVIEEEQRILAEMSEEIAELQGRLASDLRVAGLIEAAFARGTFAAAIDGIDVDVRVVGPGPAIVSLRGARHPLLAWLRHLAITDGRRAAAKVTPNDLRLDGARCLVISGPNAGGKTVALKTTGLICLLARAGVPVPVENGSVVPAFAGVTVSIGDEQNLQGGFSSFSGHLAGIKHIIDDVDADVARGPALVLLDELMSGTDPAQGAALAQAVLEDLVGSDRPVSVVVTTHYDRLKALALAEAETPHAGGRRFRNASVATDKDGRPTFVLVLDEVGTSNAFDAARRFGMKEATIARALELLAPEQKELHALLRSLAEQRQVLAGRVDDAESERTRFAGETARLEKKLVEVDAERTRLRQEGKRAFLEELNAARQTVKEAIAATQSKDGRLLNQASQTLKKLDDDVRADLKDKQEFTSALLAPTKVSVGDTVELASMPGVRLTVEAIDGDDVSLARGAVRTRAHKSQLRQAATVAESKQDGKLRKKTGSSRSALASSSSSAGGAPAAAAGPDPRTSDTSLDVRGQRAEEAIELLEAFLDKLLRQGRTTGYVLHGHGGGSLKKGIRQFLGQSRYVQKHNPGGIDDGGDAWTVIELNPDARI
jgi:DNA mismatch repair protein MutS2